jgi:putative PIN family toxin of toxin-antitoxin system
MGMTKEGLKVVLDTNVLISALICVGGLSRIVNLWKNGTIIPVFTRNTFGEFRQALDYPKFSLTNAEISAIFEEEILPYFDVAETGNNIKGVFRDPQNDKFIARDVAGRADYIVSDDEDLLVLKKYRQGKILSASEFLRKFE